MECASLGGDHRHQQVPDDRVVFEDLRLGGLDLGLLVQDLLLNLVDLVEDWQQCLFCELEFVLGFGLGGVVLFAPEGEFLVHGIDVVVDKLDALAQRSSVLADALDHALHQLQLLIGQVASCADYLLGRVLLFALAAQLAQTYLVLALLLLLGLLLGGHFRLGLSLDAFDVLGVLSILLRWLLHLLGWFLLNRLRLGLRWRRDFILLLFSLLGCGNGLFCWLFDPGSRGRAIGLADLLLLLLLLGLWLALAEYLIDIRL